MAEELLAYAVLEPGPGEPRLRLGFSPHLPDREGEPTLSGEAAREVLRWLRLNATFLSTTGAFGTNGVAAQPVRETEPRTSGWRAHPGLNEPWEPRAFPKPEVAGRCAVRE